MTSVFTAAGVELEQVNPLLTFPAPVLQLAQQLGSTTSESICALAASLCYVDLCVGDTPIAVESMWFGRCVCLFWLLVWLFVHTSLCILLVRLDTIGTFHRTTSTTMC